ncbi:MAG: DNA recombination protein RmuC [Candidatus Peregrinibacteria bacterium]|nr:DNA recombination protein RmuC [Candidatus Peregrinibacteria bacterium]
MLLYILLSVTIALLGLIAWKLFSQSEDHHPVHDMLESLRRDIQDSREKHKEYIQERMDRVGEILHRSITDNSKTMQGQFSQSAAIIKEVTEKLTKLDETNKQVLNFSEQLREFESILKQPKGKGALGEYWLGALLSHVLQPDQYKMQYKFQNGEIVDAVVYFQEKIIPIDAKFSSQGYSQMTKEGDEKKREKLEEEFKKTIKQRIDETAKYIRPEESTTDYAFMFIPAEGIYYDLLVQKVGTLDINRMNLIRYAHDKRVLIVSPNTFFAFLQTVIEGLRAFRMQESVREVLQRVELLGKHLNSYDEFMRKVGSNLSTTVNMYDNAYREFKKIDKDIYKITDGASGGSIDPLLVEKPSAHIEEAVSASLTKRSTKQFAAAADAV